MLNARLRRRRRKRKCPDVGSICMFIYIKFKWNFINISHCLLHEIEKKNCESFFLSFSMWNTPICCFVNSCRSLAGTIESSSLLIFVWIWKKSRHTYKCIYIWAGPPRAIWKNVGFILLKLFEKSTPQKKAEAL